MTPHPLSRIVRRDSVPDDGLEVDIEATVQERQALAGLLDIPAINSFSGKFHISPWRGKGLKVMGHVDADVEQTCVVTLDPVANKVSEDFEVYFLPEGASRPSAVTSGGEADDRDIEELVGERVDIGALATEYVALGLDPYPRKPDAVFDQGELGATNADEGAFAALAVLKGGRDGERS